MKKYLLLFLALGLLLTNCNSDDNIIPDPEPEQEEAEKASDYPIQHFMWQVMNDYYFWQADVPNLSDSKFAGDTDPDYIAFLGSEENPSNFFYSDLCNKHVEAVGEASAVDRFSVTVENYTDLLNSFQGISKSNGVEFVLTYFGGNNEVFGFINYIVANSDASTKDIKRGDLFVTVDGNQLYYNSAADNNLDLLFGENDTYTLGMADIIDNAIVPNDKEVTLTKQEGLVENPILVSKVIEQNGTKIGYLMYNRFDFDYDDQLNEVFGDFKNQGVTELILDFRYNPGGYVVSAIQIASAVYGTKTDEVFLRPRLNSKLQEDFGIPENFVDVTFQNETPVVSLELNKVYVITTEDTASASELVINGLEPYVDVIQIGTTTVGKNEFSNTFVDDPDGDFFYSQNRENQINPDNQWALQPLLGRNENADGFSDYTNGLVPDYELEEDIANLGVLGEDSDPLLALTLSVISGNTAKQNFTPKIPVKYATSSKMFKPAAHTMLMDGLLKPIK